MVRLKIKRQNRCRVFFPILLVVMFFGRAKSQIGINNTMPDSNAIVDISSSDKGFLVPRLTTAQREIMAASGFAQGMIVYDTDLDILFVGYGNGQNSNKWYALNPWESEYRTAGNSSQAHLTTMTSSGVNHGNVGIGISQPTKKLEANGTIKATEFIGRGAFPLGTIMLWSGKIAPTGWAICDGSVKDGFKTPDLRGRFVVGYNSGDSRYSEPGELSSKNFSPIGNTGGEDSVRLSLSEMPSHVHNASSSNAGGHSHFFEGYQRQGSNICDDDNEVSCPDSRNWSITQQTFYEGSHNHSITVNNTGGDVKHENRPPYYALAYIMRVK